MASNDCSLSCRYEMKYLISEAKAAAIEDFVRPFVRLDQYSRAHTTENDRSYPIVSLYLDSRDLCLCRESMEGRKNRFKLRIRSYTDDPDYPRFFEIKRRANGTIIKSREPVTHDSVASLISGASHPPQGSSPQEDETLGQFLLYMSMINAKPVVRTRYQRRAFEGIVDKRVRLTFDRDICYKATPVPETGLNGEGWQRLPIPGVIFEVKFTGRYPAWLGRTIQYFGIRSQSMSKYVNSIKQARRLGFCAPNGCGRGSPWSS